MKFLISAGPTREKIDPVRFLSNPSSGKMGYALAQAAYNAGHEVVLVSGPVSLNAPEGVRRIQIESAADMAKAVKREAVNSDVVIMAAAVADYRPVVAHDNKMKKADGKLTIELERTEDILKSLGRVKPENQILVGVAAETNNVIEYAKGKLKKKNLDWIVANDVSQPGRGFGTDTNAMTMISAKGDILDFPLESKLSIAEKIVRQITKP